MKARKLIGGSSFPPGDLNVIFAAFDSAWAEVAPEVSSGPEAIEAARISLATIVLSIARAGPIERDAIKADAIEAFRAKHHLVYRS